MFFEIESGLVALATTATIGEPRFGIVQLVCLTHCGGKKYSGPYQS